MADLWSISPYNPEFLERWERAERKRARDLAAIRAKLDIEEGLKPPCCLCHKARSLTTTPPPPPPPMNPKPPGASSGPMDWGGSKIPKGMGWRWPWKRKEEDQ